MVERSNHRIIGIAYNKTANAFSTAVLSPIFALNERFQGDSSLLVADIRQNLLTYVSELKEWAYFMIEKEDNTLTPQ